MPGYLGTVRISEGLASQLMLLPQMAEVHDGGMVRDSLVEGESGKVTVLPCGRNRLVLGTSWSHVTRWLSC